MKSMAKMKYHYGLKMRCYPSDWQGTDAASQS